MLDTPKRNQEQEAVPASLTTLAEQLADALAARSVGDVEPV
jgi:hypothetical protein